MQQRTTLEKWLCHVPDDVPKGPSGAEQPAELIGISPIGSGDWKLRQHGGYRDTDLRVGRMKLCLRCANVRALINDFGRQAHGHGLRQVQRVEFKSFSNVLIRQIADKGAYLIPSLFELQLERRQRGLCLSDKELLLRHVN